LQSQIQNGPKEYLLLFDIIDSNTHSELVEIKETFKKQSPKGSWENSCTYLGNILVDSLVRAKKEKDIFFDLLHQIQEVRILKERSLEREAYKQIKKVRQKAAEFQLHWIEYYCYRYELNFYADNNFPGLNDDHLIKFQMKGKDVLKSLNHIHDHYSLYELLKYRLIHSGKILSEEGKKKLNDLVLSEMVLVTGKSKSFSSQKLHLLFQSFFFTDIGDYPSALKSFYQLNELLEKNEAFLDNPPLDYLSALVGIIESLRRLGNTSEVTFYLEKLKNLDQNNVPEYFRYLVRKTVSIQQILTLLVSGLFADAFSVLNTIPSDVFNNYAMVDEEKQCELYFFSSLVHFKLGDFRKAHLFIREIMNSLKLPEQLLISKAIRLLNIIVYFEKGELVHLEYEIRSYKRYFIQSRSLKIERLLFKIISSSTLNRRISLMPATQTKVFKELENIRKDRYELELLSYFDFSEWAMNLIANKRIKKDGGNVNEYPHIV